MGGSTDFYEHLASEPAVRTRIIRFVGGSAAVTKTFGRGMSVTYVSSGVVDLDFSGNANNPGTFLGMVGLFQATTPANVKSYVAVPGAYDSSTKKLRVSMYESGTLTDLAASEWLTCICYFSEAGGTF